MLLLTWLMLPMCAAADTDVAELALIIADRVIWWKAWKGTATKWREGEGEG